MLDRTMTVGDLLKRLDPWSTDNNYDELRSILADILTVAVKGRDDYDNDVDGYALCLAHTAITGTCMDEDIADPIVHGMAGLAHYALEAAYGQKLNPETRARLERIRDIHAAFAKPPTVTGAAR